MHRPQKRDTKIKAILKEIHHRECQLQLLRQLLNQEVEFTCGGTLRMMSAGSMHSEEIDTYCYCRLLEGLIESEAVLEAVQSVLKYYNGNSLKIGIEGWKDMTLSRQDQLLAKLARQREENPFPVPKYVMNYCRKILMNEYELHRTFIVAKKGKQFQQWLYDMSHQGFVNQTILENYCREAMPELKQNSGSEIILRYLKRGLQGNLTLQQPIRLATSSNSKTINEFLRKKEENFKENECKNTKQNPFVHSQIKRKLKHTYSHLTVSKCLRQTRSIDKHILRSKVRPTSAQIRQRISAYSRQLVLNMSHFFKHLRKIIKVGIKIEQAKEKLLCQHQFNAKLLFNQIANSDLTATIIPSDLQNFLHSVGIEISQHQIFYLCKRYANDTTGKMSLKNFKGIFKTRSDKTSRKKGPLNVDTRKAVLATLLKQIELEQKIEALKRAMGEQVDLHEVFQGLDTDKDNTISRTDLQVVEHSLFSSSLSQEQLHALWWRMGLRDITELVGYYTFIWELIPRVKLPHKLHKQ